MQENLKEMFVGAKQSSLGRALVKAVFFCPVLCLCFPYFDHMNYSH